MLWIENQFSKVMRLERQKLTRAYIDEFIYGLELNTEDLFTCFWLLKDNESTLKKQPK